MTGNDSITTSVTYQDGIAVLTVGGEVDLATVERLDAAIAEALSRKPTALVIDLSEVDFFASAGLQALVATHESVSPSAEFAVVANGPATSRPIELTGLDQIFALYPTLEDAMAALKSGSE
ncbi:MAG TPA: STAS domain-containing protein [Mycobacterium sp.]|nr:STAS domain-containing protein [Mycobacterium sp.]